MYVDAETNDFAYTKLAKRYYNEHTRALTKLLPYYIYMRYIMCYMCVRGWVEYVEVSEIESVIYMYIRRRSRDSKDQTYTYSRDVYEYL